MSIFSNQTMNPVVLLAASARLTRFVVSDTLAQYWIHEPISRAVMRDMERRQAMAEHPSNGHHDTLTGSGAPSVVEEPGYVKYLDGLKCPWCVGFWLGAGVLAADQLTATLENRHPNLATVAVRRGYTLAVDALAVNMVAAPVVSHLHDQ